MGRGEEGPRRSSRQPIVLMQHAPPQTLDREGQRAATDTHPEGTTLNHTGKVENILARQKKSCPMLESTCILRKYSPPLSRLERLACIATFQTLRLTEGGRQLPNKSEIDSFLASV